MRLPQVNYRGRGVQSLGRANAGLPTALANKEAKQTTALGLAEVKSTQERWAGITTAAKDVANTTRSLQVDLAKAESTQAYYAGVMDYETKLGLSVAELTGQERVDLNTMDIPEKAKAALAAIPETTAVDWEVPAMLK